VPCESIQYSSAFQVTESGRGLSGIFSLGNRQQAPTLLQDQAPSIYSSRPLRRNSRENAIRVCETW